MSVILPKFGVAKAYYFGNGIDTNFVVPFPFIDRSHVWVSLAQRGGSYIGNASFVWLNDSMIQVTPAPTNEQMLQIDRYSSFNTRLVDYQTNSNVTEAVLDLDSRQAFYLAQEALDEAGLVSRGTFALGAAIATTEINAFAAANSAVNAAASEVNAAASAAAAAVHETNAAASAAGVAGFATTATNAASAATASELAAAASAANAAADRLLASTYATNASGSATAASGAAGSAATSAANANTSATNAATSETNAAASAAAAATFVPSLYLLKSDNLFSLANNVTARSNLGLGTMATQATTSWLDKAGNLSGLASASTARTNLGLGTMAVEAATSWLDKAGNLSGLANTTTARTNLGLGTMATQASTAYAALSGAAFVGAVSVATSLSVTENTGSTAQAIITGTGASGANVRLTGNGATTPSKTMRVANGNYEFVNSGYSAVIWTLGDAGLCSMIAGDVAGRLTVKSYAERSVVTPGFAAGVVTVDCSAGNTFVLSVTAAITGWTFTNVPTSGIPYDCRVILVSDGTSRAVNNPGAWSWGDGTAITTTHATVNKENHILLATRNGGTNFQVANGGSGY